MTEEKQAKKNNKNATQTPADAAKEFEKTGAVHSTDDGVSIRSSNSVADLAFFLQWLIDQIIEMRKKAEYATIHGPCPKCNSPHVHQEDHWNSNEQHKARCEKCNHLYNSKTRLPWLIDQIIEKAESIGLKAEVYLENGAIALTLKEVTAVLDKHEKEMATEAATASRT